MQRLITAAAVLALAAIPALFASTAPARAWHNGDRGLDRDIARTEARVDRDQARVDRAKDRGHEAVADRIQRHDLDQDRDRLDALRDRDHDHHK